jgi:hypothetical protein
MWSMSDPERVPVAPRRDSSGPLWAGAALVLLGLAFLAQNVGLLPRTGNWWALFILIPAVALLGRAWQQYGAGGASERAAGPLTGGLVLLVVAVIFLLDLDWGRAWPALPIVIGLGMLLPSLARR